LSGIDPHSGNDVVTFNASGTWTGLGNEYWGPGGAGATDSDTFVLASHFSLIAFVGPNPYYSGTTNEWGNPAYFPQPSGANGYWEIGNAPSFTTDRAGYLWFGFNDDAVTQSIGDNYGVVGGQLIITGP
jgi:hypothetical protein